MPPSLQLQLIGANTAILVLAIGLAAAPQPTARTVYVLRVPWLSIAEARHRVETAGGFLVATVAASTIMKVALPSATTLERLNKDNGDLFVASAPSILCTGSRVAAR